MKSGSGRWDVPFTSHDKDNSSQFLQGISIRAVLLILLVCAFIFGFLNVFLPYNFERLHVFLFNLTVGGFIIIHHTEGFPRPSFMSYTFLFMSVCYTLLAYSELYAYAAAVAFMLAVIVETFRIRRFSFFPWEFFSARTPAALLFHHAALLCLSLALMLSSLVILNDRFLHLFSLKKLTLDVFFLGYSFPVSLITMSVMFSFISKSDKEQGKSLEYLLFWVINPGVILFFIFILFELHVPEMLTASLLAAAVLTLFIYFIKHGTGTQQKQFLVSGMFFLLGTAVTGVIYAALPENSAGYREFGRHIMVMHSYLSLYGWNLSGLLVIMRRGDFPIRLNSGTVITFHWIIILLLAPLGKIFPEAAILSIAAYTVFLIIFFTGRKKRVTPGVSGVPEKA